jgi:hypothetical protein
LVLGRLFGPPFFFGGMVFVRPMTSDTPGVFGVTSDVARGVSRMLLDRGFSPLLEFTLPNGRRLDVAAISDAGEIAAIEIKVSLGDFRTDEKWPEYLEYCDRYYFAVPDGCPVEVMPAAHGLIVADRFGAAIVREAPHAPVTAARRKSLLIRFARTAAERFARAADPFAT